MTMLKCYSPLKMSFHGKSVAGVNVKSLDLSFRFAFIDKHFSLALWEDGVIWTSVQLKKTKARICSWSSSDRADLISD